MSGSLCGVWVDDAGRVHTTMVVQGGGRIDKEAAFRPFAWLSQAPVDEPVDGVTVETLHGEGVFTKLIQAESLAAFDACLEQMSEGVAIDTIRPWESQFLLETRQRLYTGLGFSQLRRCQLDIETASGDEKRFSDARNENDRIVAIGLQFAGHQKSLVLEGLNDAAERELLENLNVILREEDPDVIEGHNIFKFDLDYLRLRCRRLKVPCAWGRYGQNATFRNSRLKVAERWIEFPRCDLPGRSVIDTYFLVQLYDITTRELTSYGLKEVAVYFGITEEGSVERTYIEGSRIFEAYQRDRPRFLAYLGDDLRETKGLTDLLLPTYFEQTRTFPILLHEATLRGTTNKIDLLFLEEYYHARQSCPVPPEIAPFEGGFTRSFREGVYKHVLHFDVASLYPSLLLSIGRNPRPDTLGIFIPLLKRLRDERFNYKRLAKNAETPELRMEYQARQANFKILINSFYGYLGFSGARFGDGELAAEVTRRGRELLQALIAGFEKLGCTILEADTDGIYLSSEAYFDGPERLLALVGTILPKDIELEYDGRYEAMFCYKAKNYALYDGGKITVRGSALRSRGIEPFLKQLSNQLIRFLLAADMKSPVGYVEALREKIASRELPVAELAKSETLSQNPDVYERIMAEGGKPRRAAAEAALQLTPRPRMGERVTYYITAKQKGKTADWQRARPVQLYDAASAPYDPGYYLKKLEDWVERYGTFLGVDKPRKQGELDLS